MNWLSSNMPISCDFTGKCGQWIFVVTGMVFLGLGIITRKKKNERRTADVLYGKRSWATRLRDWWNYKAEPPWVMPLGFISMRDAAGRYSEAAKAGKILNDGPSLGSSEDILHWWASRIAKEVPLYGRYPSFSLLKEIPPHEISNFIFYEEATKLKDPIRGSIHYTDLAVKLEALEGRYDFESGYHSEQ